MPIISFQSHYGGPATTRVGSLAEMHSLTLAKVTAEQKPASLVPSTFAGSLSGIPESSFDGFGSKAASAIEKIIEIVASMEEGDPEAERLARNRAAGLWQLETFYEAANLTKDDLVEWMLTDDYANLKLDGMSAGEISMRAALANGTAKVIDLEEVGYRSEVSFNVHFDASGNFVGSSGKHFTNHDRGSTDFQLMNMIRYEDGSPATDISTGHNAAFVMKGAVEIYITWPKTVAEMEHKAPVNQAWLENSNALRVKNGLEPVVL